MTMTTEATPPTGTSRRTFLAWSAAAGGAAGLLATAGTSVALGIPSVRARSVAMVSGSKLAGKKPSTTSHRR